MRAIALGLALLATSSRLWAEEIVRFRVDYRAPDGCPRARDFMAGVTGRTERARIAKGPDTVVVEVRVESGASGASTRGTIHIRGGDRDEVERSISAKSCPEVVDALALITALAFDPDASADVREPSTDSPSPEEPPSTPEPPPSRGTPRWSFDAGAGLVPYDSVLPGGDVGLLAFIGAGSAGALFAPELWAVVRRRTGDTSQPSGRAEFSLTTLEVAGCPIRLPERQAFAFRPCLGFEAGALHAEGVGLTVTKRPTRFWLAPTAWARGEWTFAVPIVAFAAAGTSVPLSRQHYFFDTGERIHDIPRVSASFEVGIGARLE